MTLRDFTETNLCRWKILGVVEQTKQRRWKSASLSNKLLYSKWPFESSCFFVLGGVRTWFSPVPRGPSLGLHSSLPPFSSCRIWRKRNVSFLLFLLLRLLNWNYTPSGRPVELGWPTVFDSIQFNNFEWKEQLAFMLSIIYHCCVASALKGRLFFFLPSRWKHHAIAAFRQ